MGERFGAVILAGDCAPVGGVLARAVVGAGEALFWRLKGDLRLGLSKERGDGRSGVDCGC